MGQPKKQRRRVRHPLRESSGQVVWRAVAAQSRTLKQQRVRYPAKNPHPLLRAAMRAQGAPFLRQGKQGKQDDTRTEKQRRQGEDKG